MAMKQPEDAVEVWITVGVLKTFFPGLSADDELKVARAVVSALRPSRPAGSGELSRYGSGMMAAVGSEPETPDTHTQVFDVLETAAKPLQVGEIHGHLGTLTRDAVRAAQRWLLDRNYIKRDGTGWEAKYTPTPAGRKWRKDQS